MEQGSNATLKGGAFKPKNDAQGRPVQTNGQRVGDYQLLELLGEGEFGYVYKALQISKPESKEYYAIKVLKPEHAGQDFSAFAQEARILQKLSHKSLPKLVATGISRTNDAFNKAPYLVMEFIAGEDLQICLKKGPINPDTLLRWAYEITAAVAYLHSQEIIHRDLKPSNILVAWSKKQSRSIKIVDFGIALLRRQLENRQEISGSLRYMSPEQLVGKKVGKPSDIYALGLILYEILNGSFPYEFTGKPDFKLWQEIHTRSIPQEITNRLVPNPIALLIRRCLEKLPEQRPTADELVQTMEKEVAGIGQPSFIGILGARGSGKTCYLTSLYSEIEMGDDSKKLLEDKYLALYEHGIVPSATALSTYRLNLRITTPEKFYDIITKDYGGELLAGRRQDDADESMLEKREEIYEFFQSARAILILVETKPAQNLLQNLVDYRNEIQSLIEKIATFRNGVRKIGIPVGIVLTKWDRMGNLSDDPHKEKERAMQYVAQTSWLTKLYDNLKILCPYLEVFPVFSFIGDKPDKNNIRPFNVCAPLIWASDKGDVCLWEKCLALQQEHPQAYRDILENYWRLLQIENIGDIRIRQQAESALVSLSRQYLDFVKANVKKDASTERWVIGQYQQYLQTKGITAEDRAEAARLLRHHRSSFATRTIRRVFATMVMVLLLGYIGWEWWGNYSVQRALIMFNQDQLSPQEFLSQVHRYRQYKPIGVWRWFREPQISREVQSSLEEWGDKKTGLYRNLMDERLIPAPEPFPNFGKADLGKIEEQLRIAQSEVTQDGVRVKQLEELLSIKNNCVKKCGIAAPAKLQQIPVEARFQLVNNHYGKWDSYQKYLTQASGAFNERATLLRRWETLTKSSALAVDPDPDKWQEQCKQWPKTVAELEALLQDCESYEQKYPKSPFVSDMQQLAQKVKERLEQCQLSLKNLRQKEELHQRYQTFTQKMLTISRIEPLEKDDISTLQNKLATIQQLIKEVQLLLEDCSKMGAAEPFRAWCQECTKAIPELQKRDEQCQLLLLQRNMEKLMRELRLEADDTIESLDIKVVNFKEVLAQLEKFQCNDINLKLKLAGIKQENKNKLESQIKTLEEARKELEELENLCAKYAKDKTSWQGRLREKASYTQCLKEVAWCLEKLRDRPRLASQYSQPLKDVEADLEKSRRADRKQYQGVEDKVMSSKFVDASNSIVDYLCATDHPRLMAADLESYLTQFSCEVKVEVSVGASAFTKENKPDFRLYTWEDSDMFLGIYWEKPQDSSVVRYVMPDSVARKAGLRQGDIIWRCNGKNVQNQDDFLAAIPRGIKSDERIPVEVQREGANLKIDIVWGSEPFRNGRRLDKLSKDDQPKDKPIVMGELWTKLDFRHNYQWFFDKIQEEDTMGVSEYGSFKVEIQALLNNKTIIEHPHKCGKDGEITVKLEATELKAKPDLPRFKD